MPRSIIEALEIRRHLSVSLTESEPNDTQGSADFIPRVLGEEIAVNGSVNALGDRDWFKIDLRLGDVFGAALTGAAAGVDTMIHVYDAAGELVIGNDDSFLIGEQALPPESPLPRNNLDVRDSETYCVITAPGTYYLEVSAFADETAGAYELDVLVARPGMEARPAGTRQVFFLDFDGARVDFSEFLGQESWGTQKLAPLSKSLKAWALKKSDLDPLVDATVARITDKVSTFVRNISLNGDFAKTGVAGQFDVEIRNSRDHRDQFGRSPVTSRITFGASDFTPLTDGIAIGQFNDVGNFRADDEAIVTTNYIADLLAAYPVEARATKIAFIAEFLSLVAAHEIGHITGTFHTDYNVEDPFEGKENIMDKVIQAPLGPDLMFGTADDISMRFGTDRYSRLDQFQGIHDTLNTVAFGLSTGMARRGGIGGGGDHHDDARRHGGFALAGSFAAGGRQSLFDSTDDDDEDDSELARPWHSALRFTAAPKANVLRKGLHHAAH